MSAVLEQTINDLKFVSARRISQAFDYTITDTDFDFTPSVRVRPRSASWSHPVPLDDDESDEEDVISEKLAKEFDDLRGQLEKFQFNYERVNWSSSPELIRRFLERG
jgi:cation diffusion facilitator CzcD-associated flavoprotein CzcO